MNSSREDAKTRSMNIEELSAVVVDTAFQIHRDIGPGLLESVYQKVLVAILREKGFTVDTEVPVEFQYAGLSFSGELRIDLLVNGRLIVELKSVEAIAPVHTKQVLTYLRLKRFPLGLLINFGAALFKEGCRRIVNNHTETASSLLRINHCTTSRLRVRYFYER